MPSFRPSEDTEIHWYEDGDPDGFPLLCIAPGGMRSAAEKWTAMPWNPKTELEHFRIIEMDQRNAGASVAPVRAGDGWHVYRDDQLALLDHLGIQECHVLGMCIGGPYVFGLLKAAPDRFRAAVVLQPVGIDENREALEAMFDAWRDDIAEVHPEADDAVWDAFRAAMWGGDFVLTATAEELAAISTPTLVLMGNDLYHPESISRAVVDAMPNATLVERWKAPGLVESTTHRVREFLAEQTPD